MSGQGAKDFLFGSNPLKDYEVQGFQFDPKVMESIRRRALGKEQGAGSAAMRLGMQQASEQATGAVRSQRGISPALAARMSGRMNSEAGMQAADRGAMISAQEQAAASQQFLGLEDMRRQAWQAHMQAEMAKAQAGAHEGLLGIAAGVGGQMLPFAFMGGRRGGGQQQSQQPPPFEVIRGPSY